MGLGSAAQSSTLFSGRFGGYGYSFGHGGAGFIGIILIIVVAPLRTGRLELPPRNG